MQRRAMLERIGAVGTAGALAGCVDRIQGSDGVGTVGGLSGDGNGEDENIGVD